MEQLRSIEICAGAGGQALGLENAGFSHEVLVEIDHQACKTLQLNRPEWKVLEMDVRNFHANGYEGIDLLAGGVPCPPFSIAGSQLGANDERDLFPEMIRLISECKPKAVMIENVRGLLDNKFTNYRKNIAKEISRLGYKCFWNLFDASKFGVPQTRQRTTLVALKPEFSMFFKWPEHENVIRKTVGEVLLPEMSKNGWKMAQAWSENAAFIAPTIVGGSKKHGGPDLGPTRAKAAWAKLGVNGHGIADNAPSINFVGKPKLTVKMASIIQGFPESWEFYGKKTSAYRQVGNAFPPPVAQAIGASIHSSIIKGLQFVWSIENVEEARIQSKTERVFSSACGPSS